MAERGVLANLIVRLGLDSQEYDKELGKASGRLKGIGADLTTVGTQVTAFGVAGAAAFGLAAKSAASFQSDLTNVTNLLGDAGTEFFDDFSDGVKQISADFGLSKDVLTQGLFDIVSAGTDASDAIGVLCEASKLSVAGVSSVDSETSALLTTLSTYGDQVRDAADASDFLFSVQKVGRTTLDEVAASFGKVAPLASQAGLSLNDLGASLATATGPGIKMAEVVTSIQQLLKTFIQPSNQAKKAAAELGIELNANALQGENFQETLSKISKGTIEQKTAIAGSVEAFRALGPIVQNVGKYQENYAAVVDRQGTTQEAANAINETAEKQLEKLGQTVDNLAITAGEALLPAITDLSKEILPVVQSIAEWAAENPELTKSLVLAGAASAAFSLTVGPMIALTGQLAGGFGSVASVGARLPGLLKNIGGSSVGAAAGLRAVAATLIGPAGIAAGAIAAAAALAYLTVKAKQAADEHEDLHLKTQKLRKSIIAAARESGMSMEEVIKLQKELGRREDEHLLAQYAARVRETGENLGFLKKETEGATEAEKDLVRQTEDAVGAAIEAAEAAASKAEAQRNAAEAAEELKKAIEEQQAAVDASNAAFQRFDLEPWIDQNAQAIASVAGLQAALDSTSGAMSLLALEAPNLNEMIREQGDTANATAAQVNILAAEWEALTGLGPTLASSMDDIARSQSEANAELLDMIGYTPQLPPEWDKVTTSVKNSDTALRQVSTAITDLGKDIGDIIVDGGKLTDVFKSFGETIIRIASEQVIGLLLSKLGELVELIPGLSKLSGILFGGVGGASGGIGGIAGGIGGQVAGGVGGAGSTAGTIASAGLTGTLGAAFGGVSAVTGVLGLFQGRQTNKGIDAVALHTLEIKNLIAGSVLPALWFISDYIQFGTQIKVTEQQRDALWEIRDILRAGISISGSVPVIAGGGDGALPVNVEGPVEVAQDTSLDPQRFSLDERTIRLLAGQGAADPRRFSGERERFDVSSGTLDPRRAVRLDSDDIEALTRRYGAMLSTLGDVSQATDFHRGRNEELETSTRRTTDALARQGRNAADLETDTQRLADAMESSRRSTTNQAEEVMFLGSALETVNPNLLAFTTGLEGLAGILNEMANTPLPEEGSPESRPSPGRSRPNPEEEAARRALSRGQAALAANPFAIFGLDPRNAAGALILAGLDPNILRGGIPSFHSGGIMPHEGYAYLDKGELTIPEGGVVGIAGMMDSFRDAFDGRPSLSSSMDASMGGMRTVMTSIQSELGQWGERLESIDHNTRELRAIEENTRETAGNTRWNRGSRAQIGGLKSAIQRNDSGVRETIRKVK